MLVIGIGSEFRRDDGVGIAVVRAVRALDLPGVEVSERSGEGTDLIAAWRDRRVVFVVDAVSAGAPAGTIHRFDHGPGFPGNSDARIFRGTSHELGLGEAIDLGGVLGRLPDRLVVYGIEGAEFGDGVGLSPSVERAAELVVSRLAVEAAAAAGHDAGVGQRD